MNTFEDYNLKEWKLIYVTLHKSVLTTPELMDIDFFNDLQTYLQKKAEKTNLDPIDHDTWINWLNNAKNCGVSVSTKNRSMANVQGATLPEIPTQ
ncbi:MAG: hypothetical protein HN973_00780 [Lentimicrobiaceae bacterium]|jgi:hypothetical protein|nr:hypothetical protein [Lentimicrobiaceae bacterium]